MEKNSIENFTLTIKENEKSKGETSSIDKAKKYKLKRRKKQMDMLDFMNNKASIEYVVTVMKNINAIQNQIHMNETNILELKKEKLEKEYELIKIQSVIKPYDVIYNVFYHQSIEYVNDHIRNTAKFNKNNKYLIVAHLSNDLYSRKDQILNLNILINPNHSDKVVFSWNLMQGRLKNYEFLIEKGIKFNHMMIISATGRFVRQTPHFPEWPDDPIEFVVESSDSEFEDNECDNIENSLETINDEKLEIKCMNELCKPSLKYGYSVNETRVEVNCEFEKTYTHWTSARPSKPKHNNIAKKQIFSFSEACKKKTMGVPNWFKEMNDINPKLKSSIKDDIIEPIFKKNGIFIAFELINTWMCSRAMMDKINTFCNSTGYIHALQKRPLEERMPHDEYAIPSLSRHFDFNYCAVYNNRPYCCFPQGVNIDWFKHVTPEFINLAIKDDPKWFYFKKITDDTNSSLYKKIHKELQLI